MKRVINGKTVVLTGATGGIGRAVATLLAAQGVILILAARDERKLQQLQQQLGEQHHIVATDISTDKGRRTLIDYCEQLDQDIDIVINNAGLGHFSTLDSLSEQEISDIINLNLTSQILLCKAFLPVLRQKPDNTIVNVGSVLGSIGHPGYTVYCASKYGLRGFTEALAREEADSAIAIRYFAPRTTATSMNTDLAQQMNLELGNKVDSAEFVAEQLLGFLLSTRQRHILGSPEKFFIKMNNLFPSLVDSAIAKKLTTIKRYL